jgi:F-type H+-transporting ATPase subunit delta
MSVITISKRYAKSLVDLALEQNRLEEINSEVHGIMELINQSRDLALMLKSPIVKADSKQIVLKKILQGQVSELMLAFISIVVRKKREPLLLSILKAFVEKYNEIKGITPVTLITAVSIDDQFKADIKVLMNKKYDKSNVIIEEKVDDDLIGGFVLEFEDKKVDTSVSYQLDKLRRELKNN